MSETVACSGDATHARPPACSGASTGASVPRRRASTTGAATTRHATTTVTTCRERWHLCVLVTLQALAGFLAATFLTLALAGAAVVGSGRSSGRGRSGVAENRHREGESDGETESGEEGLFHGFISFVMRVGFECH